MIGLSIICPLRETDDPPDLNMGPEDELVIATGGNPGEARHQAAAEANNDWLVLVDNDARYPPDYLDKIRKIIELNPGIRGFRAKRNGGLWYLLNIEASMVIRKDLLFERVPEFDGNGVIDDFGFKFWDLPEVRVIEYDHSFTRGEKKIMNGLAIIAGGVGGGLLGNMR